MAKADESTQTMEKQMGPGTSLFHRLPTIPHRYMVAVMAGLCCWLPVGTRTAFALVMTHVTSSSQSSSTSASFIFEGCTVYNTSRDLHVHMGGDVMFLVHTVYYVCLAVMMFPGSVLSTGLSPKLVVAVAMGVTSVTSLFFPLVIPYSTVGVAILRVLQGALEGIMHPAIMGIVASWSTSAEKSRLYGITGIGINLAPAAASGLAAIFLCYVSWDGIFFLYGGAGLLWVAAWLRWFYSAPDIHPSLDESERQLFQKHGNTNHRSSAQLLKSVPWLSIIRSRGVWAVFIGIFSANVIRSLLGTQEPQYFMDAFHIRVEDIGVLSTVPYLSLAAASMVGGVVSDRLVKAGMPTTTVRKAIYSTAYGVQGLCFLALYWISDWQAALGIMWLGVPFGGMALAAVSSLPSDMAPPFTTVILGLALLGTLGGAVSTATASAIAGNTKSLQSWQSIFLVTGVMDMVSVLLFNLTADATHQPWAEVTLPATTANQNAADSGDDSCSSDKEHGESSESSREDDATAALLWTDNKSERILQENTNTLKKYGTLY